MFQHEQRVGRGQRHGAAGAALADDDADQRHAKPQARFDAAGDGGGLAARFRVDARIGPGRVHQGDHRQGEMVGQRHQALRLAVALGPRHAEVVGDARLRVRPLFGADDDHRTAAEPSQAADDRPVLGERPVAGEEREVLEQGVDVIEGMGPVGVAGHLGLLPRRELGIGLLEQLVDLGLQLAHFLGDVDLAGTAQVAQSLDLALQFGDGLLEVQEAVHGAFLAQRREAGEG